MNTNCKLLLVSVFIFLTRYGGAQAEVTHSPKVEENFAKIERQLGKPLSQLIAQDLTSIPSGNIDKIREAIEHYVEGGILGSNPDSSETLRWRLSQSPLSKAIENGDVELVKKLIAQRASLKARDIAGHTPLHIAAILEYPEIVKILAQAGADTEAQTYHHGLTPLHLGTSNKEVIEELIKARANVNASDTEGYTPLYFAIDTGDEDPVKLLIDAGADVSVTTKYGETPLSYAQKFGYTSIANLIKSELAKPRVARVSR